MVKIHSENSDIVNGLYDKTIYIHLLETLVNLINNFRQYHNKYFYDYMTDFSQKEMSNLLDNRYKSMIELYYFWKNNTSNIEFMWNMYLQTKDKIGIGNIVVLYKIIRLYIHEYCTDNDYSSHKCKMMLDKIKIPENMDLVDVCTEYYDYEFYNDLVKNCSTSYNPKNYESSYIILTKKEKFVKIFKNLIPTLW